jgi:hypothetical protein
MDDPRITTEEGEPAPTLRPVVETGFQTTPLPPPPPAPPPADTTLWRDREHLDTLAAFHYILGGLQCLGLVLIPLYAVYIYFVFCTDALMPGQTPFPPEFGWILEGFLGVAFVLSGIWAVCLWLTGRDLRLRRQRTFCFVIACIHCIQVPLGTVLGIFSILVLRRESVKELFRTGDPRTPEDDVRRDYPYAERRKEKEWLKVLSICHFALAGFLALVGVLSVIYLMLGIFMLTAVPPPPRPGGPPPPSFTVLGWIMIVVGIFMFVMLYGQATMAALTGYYIRKRKRWMFCLAGSGIQCLNAPFGIALCVFTVLVLMRYSVRADFKYGEAETPLITDEDYA